MSLSVCALVTSTSTVHVPVTSVICSTFRMKILRIHPGYLRNVSPYASAVAPRQLFSPQQTSTNEKKNSRSLCVLSPKHTIFRPGKSRLMPSKCSTLYLCVSTE